MSVPDPTQQQFFKSIRTSFKDVPTSPGVDTVKFCDASEGLVKVFDLLGSSAFSIVQSDLTGNITKVRARLISHPAESATLEDLIANEKKEGKKESGSAREGLLWLLRGLKFTGTGLRRSLSDPNEELATSFTKSYEVTLRQHHSFVIRPVFSLAMKACPYRATFYPKLGSPPEEVNAELDAWLAGLEKILAQMEAVYKSGGYGTV